jgi:catechol 2,3-dioxygenase
VAQIRQVTLRARSAEALQAVAEAVPRAGGTVVSPIGPLTRNPAGGTGLTLRDPHGRILQVVHGDTRVEDRGPQKDKPQRLTHVVLNSHAVDETQRFLTEALGFTLADRTVAIAFMNCNADHHTLAIGISDNDALNHIAFLMPDYESVMRGGGRMKDAGHPIQWGPGRHGPGNNLFNYFIDPFGVVIEYTAEVEQVDDSYRPRGPDEWKWPPGRVDQWGISPPPGPTLKEAQRRVLFVS